MSDQPTGGSATGTATNVGSTAKDSAGQVAGTAADQVKQVSGTATDQAKQVAGTATDQARGLAAQARDRLSEEAAAQNEKAVTGLRALADELDSMTHHDGEAGVATDLARRGRGYAQSAADFLDAREPGDLVGELRGFARRRPGAFLAGALVAGIVAGRLTRGVKASTGNDIPAGTGAAGEPARLAAPLANDRRMTAADDGDTSAYPPVPEFGDAGGGALDAPDDDAAGYQAREDDAGVAGARIDPAALPDRDEARP